MAKKTKLKINFGTLPREGYVYGLYRGHIIRLGVVVAVMIAILAWTLSGTWPTIKSYLFPSGKADLAAISEMNFNKVASDPQRTVFQPEQIESVGLWMQDSCYRLEITFDDVKATELSYDGVQMYVCSAEGYEILAAATELPVTGKVYQAVFVPVSDQLSYFLPDEYFDLPGYFADLRNLPVGYEGSDTIQVIIFVPIVVLLAVYWLLQLQDPRRHPIYGQLAKYGPVVDAVVQSIDREIAAGQIIDESRNTLTTPTWVLKKSAFTTTISKNTAHMAENK